MLGCSVLTCGLRSAWRGLGVCVPMLTKWSLPTRLETRTKESNMCASVGWQTLMRNESERGGPRCTHRPTMILL